MKNFIFLDIDGVLTSARLHVGTQKQGMWSAFDPIAVSFLEKVCRAWPAEIVISSTWRKLFERADFTNLFGTSNLDNYIHQNWKTDNIGERRIEIANWLQDHGGDEFNYLIIDDDNEWFDWQEKHVIRTDPQEGMLLEHYVSILDKTQLRGKL